MSSRYECILAELREEHVSQIKDLSGKLALESQKTNDLQTQIQELKETLFQEKLLNRNFLNADYKYIEELQVKLKEYETKDSRT